MLFEIFLVRIHHAVEPWQELLGAVVCVKDDRNTVGWGDGTNVVSSRNSSSNRSRLVFVVDAFSRKVGCTALGGLQDDWGFLVTGRFQSGNDSG